MPKLNQPIEDRELLPSDIPTPQKTTDENQTAGQNSTGELQQPLLAPDQTERGESLCGTRCQEAIQREIDDLRAQQSMARSTEGMVSLTRWQLIVGGAGFALLIFTLVFNAVATIAQVRATKISHQMLRAERAWVLFKGIHAAPAGSRDNPNERIGFVFSSTVINAGKTPAKNVRIKTQKYIVAPGSVPEEFAIQLPSEKEEPGATIGQGDTRNYGREFFSMEELKRALEQQIVLLIYTKIAYSDIWDASHETADCVKVIPIVAMDILYKTPINTAQTFAFEFIPKASYAT